MILNSKNFNAVYTNLPVNIWINNSPQNCKKIEMGSAPNLIIKKNDNVKYVVINGFIYDVENSEGKILNGLVFY